jgi:antitoxin (DNA-binding transcriptional repressor) of toxin-antitoxin stability system
MIYVGIREMENHVKEFVRRVQDGETVLVTMDDKIVAKLTKPGRFCENLDEDTARLEEDGLLSRLGAENRPELYKGLRPLLQKGAGLQLLNAERGDR